MDFVPTELISYDGEFKKNDLDKFISSVKLHECGFSYKVAAIMGAQHTGKSTLLNYVFGTKFTEGKIRPKATTKGVWISKAQQEPFTLVLDLEGTDGKDRGENDTTFEKQSALFALVFADIILINMFDNAFDTVHGASRPLLRTIFEVVITMNSFTPRKTTLFYVMRDTAPFNQSLKNDVIEDVEKIWKEVRGKPSGDKNAILSTFFNVEFYALPNYHLQREVFQEEVAKHGQQISHLISAGLADDRPCAVHASGFCLTAKEIWENIKKNKDLDLPSVRVMVDTELCKRIVKDKLELFELNYKNWLASRNAAETGLVSEFSATITSILDTSLSQYDSQSIYLEEKVRDENRQYLESEALRLVHPDYVKNLGHLRSQQFQNFKTDVDTVRYSEEEGFAQSIRDCKDSCMIEFDRRCSDSSIRHAKWEESRVSERNVLLHDIEIHMLIEKLPYVVDQCRKPLYNNVCRELSQLFTNCDENLTWATVRRIITRESNEAASNLSSAVASFELEQARHDRMEMKMRRYAEEIVERKFKDENIYILELMKKRYIKVVGREYLLRSEPSNVEEQEAASFSRESNEAFRECLKLLSTMAVLRFDGRDDDEDVVERMLFSALMVDADSGDRVSDDDSLASSTWEENSVTLITPSQCTNIWETFKRDMEQNQTRANHEQEVYRDANHRSPPRWVIVGLVTLGAGGLSMLLWATGLDLVLFASFAIRGITFVGAGISIAGTGMELYREIRELFQEDFNTNAAIDQFRTRHGIIMRSIERALRDLSEHITALIRGNSRVATTA